MQREGHKEVHIATEVCIKMFQLCGFSFVL